MVQVCDCKHNLIHQGLFLCERIHPSKIIDSKMVCMCYNFALFLQFPTLCIMFFVICKNILNLSKFYNFYAM